MEKVNIGREKTYSFVLELKTLVKERMEIRK